MTPGQIFSCSLLTICGAGFVFAAYQHWRLSIEANGKHGIPWMIETNQMSALFHLSAGAALIGIAAIIVWRLVPVTVITSLLCVGAAGGVWHYALRLKLVVRPRWRALFQERSGQ